MPRPSGPPLLVACYDGRLKDVRKLLAAGADPRLPCGDQRISARYAAAELLRLGYQIGSGVLVPVWAEHVIPFLVSRTSRGAVPDLPPQVLFIDALSDDEVAAMLEGDYAEHATLEIERRAVERLVRSC